MVVMGLIDWPPEVRDCWMGETWYDKEVINQLGQVRSHFRPIYGLFSIIKLLVVCPETPSHEDVQRYSASSPAEGITEGGAEEFKNPTKTGKYASSFCLTFLAFVCLSASVSIDGAHVQVFGSFRIATSRCFSPVFDKGPVNYLIT